MSEDVTVQAFQIVLRSREELLERVRRFDEALTYASDPVRKQVGAELLELVGLACITCGARCVPGPECETCQDNRAALGPAAAPGCTGKTGARP